MNESLKDNYQVEVADLIGFLASPQAAYSTGQIISINGGMI